MIEIGKKAPAFTLYDAQNQKRSLKEFSGKWVVLYFYPKDDTPGCTREAIEFTKNLKKFEKLNAVVIGVSPDAPESHCKFQEKHKLKVILLSDPQHKVLEKYGAWGLKKQYGREYYGVKRSTVLIDPSGKIAYHWKSVKPDGHSEQVLKKIKELLEKRS